MISLDFLEKVSVFQDLNDDQLTAVQALCKEVDYSRGDKIFSAGEAPRYLWAVIEGQVDLVWDSPDHPDTARDTITSLSVHMAFGWSSLVPPYKYRLSAVCTSRSCRLLRLNTKDLMALFKNNSVIGYHIMSQLLAIISTRFHPLQDEIAKNRGHDIINRW